MKSDSYFLYEPAGLLRATGPDAKDFLQGQFSNDLAASTPGTNTYGLWLDRKGKILADSFVLQQSDEQFLLLSYFCDTSAIEARLDAYLIMDDVELLAVSGAAGATVFGSEAQAAVSAALGMTLPDAEGVVFSKDVFAFWGRRAEEPSLELVALDGEASLRAVLEKQGLMELNENEMSKRSLDARIPRIGKEFGEADLPQELGLETSAVSFTKGCYLGQEVMARLHAMGRVRKRLESVRIEFLDAEKVQFDLPADLLSESGKRRGSLRLVSGETGLAVVSLDARGESLSVAGLTGCRVSVVEVGHG